MPKWRRFRQSSNPTVRQAELQTANIIADTANDVVDQGRALLGDIVDSTTPVLSSVLSGLEAAFSQFSYTGSTGNFQTALELITLSGKFQPIVDQYPEKIGSPLHKTMMLRDLSGFVLCENAVFSAVGATSIEEQAVEAFMNGGFFYE